MEKAFCVLALTVYLLMRNPITCSKIRLDDNEYEGILVALPPTVAIEDRTRIISSLEELLQCSSAILADSTKGRARLGVVTFLVPRKWDTFNATFSETEPWMSREGADIVVTAPNEDEQPYTLHHLGCGRRSLRIYLPAFFLTSDDLQQRSVTFVRLWSEFRYGVFPEGGFNSDDIYPTTYQMPEHDENRTTGCTDENYRHPNLCDDRERCSQDSSASSLMDQHLPSTATAFCEGEMGMGAKHNPNSTSKHNLLCSEEGTWFTVMRSPDFAGGGNQAPKFFRKNNVVTFRFVKEVPTPRIMVAIDVSKRMQQKSRYSLARIAFTRFVYDDVPDGTELTLIIFGDAATFSAHSVQLDNADARNRYLEGQRLPEDPTNQEEACVECLLDRIFKLRDGDGNKTSPILILLTTQPQVNGSQYAELRQKLKESDIIVHALLFDDEHNGCTNTSLSLFSLCSETGGSLVVLGKEPLGNLYVGFAMAVRETNTDTLIAQEYLPELDEEDLSWSFVVDDSLAQSLKISISGPLFNTVPLYYARTVLEGPNNISAGLQKKELLSAWNFHVSSPQVGIYTVFTRRKNGASSPVLITAKGVPHDEQDLIKVRIWIETVAEGKLSYSPVVVFAEVRKGIYPVSEASVTAYVQHPGREVVSEFQLLDDGLGGTDITRDDGVYGRYFTRFTTPGFYNVYVKVKSDAANVLKGPIRECCGSSFPWSERRAAGRFQREAGPVTFQVTAVPDGDTFPPSRVTDLRLSKNYDRIYILQWTAVGDDYDQGTASLYELKLFPDRSLIRSRFSGSGLELYEETISTTSDAIYGKTLYHIVSLPRTIEGGTYFFGIRALDEAGNAGLPSNALPVLVDEETNTTTLHCTDEDRPIAERLNSVSKSIPVVLIVMLSFIAAHL